MIFSMSEKKRITIMLDDKVLKKARVRQAKIIADDQVSASFSKIINEDLAKYYKIANFVY